MNILIDTNIFIYFEDYKVIDESFTKLYNLCSKFNHNFFIHPSSIDDINNDKNLDRRKVSLSKIQKYSVLENPKFPSERDIESLGFAENNSHDKIDNIILYALYRDSANLLLTQDIGIIKKARKIGIDHRVMFVQQALHSFNKLHLQHEIYYPNMMNKYLYELNKTDNIFESLREDYPEFDNWFSKISQEHRKCWIHGYNGDTKIGGILIYKDENNPIVTNDDKALRGKVLKISTFKISEHMQGWKLGELFIKTVFAYANKNKYEYIYLTTRQDKQEYLVSLIEDFGFRYFGRCDKDRDEVFVKQISINGVNNTHLNAIDFHKMYSPSIKCRTNINKFIVPVKPEYHNILFPEIEDDKRLFYTHPSVGNTIKKAYLSHANTNQMKSGDLLFFYRSQDKMAITTLGIVEKTFKSADFEQILEEVAKRTVYSYDEIRELAKKETNIILFRLIEHFDSPFITKDWMRENNIYKNCQSICKVEDDYFYKILDKGKVRYCIEKEVD
ncbi:MAG: GNAT family N-acetyltransferase [Campylobacterales bacterium]|nr:GNAT family N-acetyltransferase [Campylobacterales bacterium]